MPQLDFSVFPSQLFWLTVSFFLMLFIFSKFIIPKTAEMIKLRKEKIDENIEAAAKIKEKVEKALEKYNQALRDATDKAQISLQRTKDELNDTINRRQEDLNARLKLEVEAGEKKVAASRDKALQKLEEVSCALAVDVLHKVGFEDIKLKDATAAFKRIKKD
ncbi:MAG: hypothetical protein MJ210_05625 [Alphaproteobacteria bacterium]|nr:hypothetical protein [Alphaproteobacteria bacterium]